MLKITVAKKFVERALGGKREPGKIVEVKVEPPTDEFPKGGVVVYLGRRISYNSLWKKFAFSPMAWSFLSRNKRLHTTAIPLTPGEAALLRQALNNALEDAGLTESLPGPLLM